MDFSFSHFWLPIFFGLIIFSPIFFRITQFAILRHQNRWRKPKLISKIRSKKYRQKSLENALKARNIDDIAEELIKNPHITVEEVNNITLQVTEYVLYKFMQDSRITPETLNKIAEKQNIQYNAWYVLTESDKVEEATKVFLALNNPEYVTMKSEGRIPGQSSFYGNKRSPYYGF